MDLIDALRRLHGAGRREQLLALGVKRAAIDRAVQRGDVDRYRSGCYSLPGASTSVKTATALRAQLTCVSALDSWNLPILEPRTTVHVAVARHRGMGRASFDAIAPPHVHHSVHAESSRGLLVEPWVALDHLGTCASPLAQLVAVDAALHSRLMKPHMITRFSATDIRRRGWLARMTSSSAESLIESLSRVAIEGAGLAVAAQVRIKGVGRVDLIVEGRVVVELDGREYHATSEAFARDRKRDRALVLAGFVVLRYTYREVMFERERLVAEVRAAVGLVSRVA